MKKILLILSFMSILFITAISAETVFLNNENNAVNIEIIESQLDFTILEITLNNYTKDSVIIDNQEFLTLNLKSEGISLDRGNPALPVIGRSLMIPSSAKMNVEILSQEFFEIEGQIAPSKGSLLRNVNPMNIPYEFSNTYKEDSFYPKSLVELGDPYILRDIRGIAFRVTPFSYNPVQGLIRCYNKITIKVYADGIDTINTLTRNDNKVSKDFVTLYRNHFLNYQINQTRYESIEEQGSILVICYPDFVEAMQPYIAWKNQKGIPTELVTTEITGTSNTAIQAYIVQYWEENPELAFIQLVGDAAQIPTPSYAGGGSDPSYVMLLGNDHYPEMFIGRFSAENISQVQTQVERTINYERDIVDGDWLAKASSIASSEGGGSQGDNGESDIQHQNIIRGLLLDYTYTEVDQFYEPGATAAQVATALNAGRGFMNYTGHGSNTSWSTTGFSNTNINALTNDNTLPFIVSVACVNGNFTGTTCFAEAWLRATNSATGAPTGAVNIYASTINQPWNEPMRGQDIITELLVNEEKNTIGGLFFNGSSGMLDVYPGTSGVNTMRTWHIFGDASLQVRTTPPMEMIINASETLFIGLDTYTVTVDTPGALVSLYHPENDELLGFAFADEIGEANISLENPLTEPCTLLLTTSAYNRITDIREVGVIPNEGPYLVYESVSFPENQGPNFGSTTSMNVTFYNVGSEDAENVSVTLISNDEYIEIISNEAELSLVESEGYFELTDAFEFSVADDVPDQHSAQFTIIAEDTENQWTMNFTINLNAPILAFGDYFIVENTGNDNNRLDPGETVEIYIPFFNSGHATSSNGSIIMFTNNPQIYIAENSIIVNNIEADSVSYAVYSVTADEEIELGSRVNFGYFAEFSSHQFQNNFDIPVGLLIEDFETADLSSFEWANNSMNPWEIIEDVVYEGTYSLKSGNISDNQTSTLSISRTLTAPGIISFWIKVSSEPVLDKLQFYINNNVVESWSGEQDWIFVEYEVEQGNNLFRWVYRKDGSGAEGLDSAWIDFITFPLSGGTQINGPLMYLNTNLIEFNDTIIGGTYMAEFSIVNFGNQSLQGTINSPDGYSVYLNNETREESLTYNIIPNSNNNYSVVFRPIDDISYDSYIIITSNDENTPADSIHIIGGDFTSIGDVEIPVLSTSLMGNYPNPFNPETEIKFSVASEQKVEISVYNIKGQLVKTLVNKSFDKGRHSVIWTGKDQVNRNVSSGVYFYKFSTPEKVQVRKMMLIK